MIKRTDVEAEQEDGLHYSSSLFSRLINSRNQVITLPSMVT